MTNSRLRSCLGVCAASVLLIGRAAPAANLSFNVDTSLSQLTAEVILHKPASGPIKAVTFGAVEQAPGSLVASLSGTIDTDTDLTTTIEILPTSQIIPAVTGNWDPQPVPDNFGAQNGDPIFGIGFVSFALHDALFNVDSAGALPVAATAFASTIDVGLIQSTFEYGSAPLGSGSLGYLTLSNAVVSNVGGAGSLVVVGNQAKLTIPVDVTFVTTAGFPLNQPGGPYENFIYRWRFTGDVVATAMIPEPSAGIMGVTAGLALVGCVAGRRARRLRQIVVR